MKTEKITFTCKNVLTEAYDHDNILVTIQQPDVKAILLHLHIDDLRTWLHLHIDDLRTWLRDNVGPGDVFNEKELALWAKKNGFIKE